MRSPKILLFSLLLLVVVIGAGASFVQFVRSLKGDVTGAVPQSPTCERRSSRNS